MSKLVWDEIGSRKFETGLDHGVLYLAKDGKYDKGVVWNGLIQVTENASGAEANDNYADNMKYLTIRGAETLGLTIECYYTPEEFDACDGSASIIPGVSVKQQNRATFGMSYRTQIGNDTDNIDHGYKLHLAYGCSVSPSERSYQTINESPEPGTLSYEATTTPVPIDGFKPSSLITIDSTLIEPDLLAKVEKILYGDEENEARLPLPSELIRVLQVEG